MGPSWAWAAARPLDCAISTATGRGNWSSGQVVRGSSRPSSGRDGYHAGEQTAVLLLPQHLKRNFPPGVLALSE